METAGLHQQKDRPVGLTDCERVSRQLSRELDVSDPIAHAYDLEVSSPGIERVLREAWHFERAVGESVAVRWRDESGRARTDIGVLERVDEVRLVLQSRESVITVDLDAVLSARIHVEW
jgi:ribosome maturation factor RimP